ncbi:MAG: rRNA small subunit methyltransferase 1 [Nitrospirae bacterium]|nr:rRNA small subunit methyltransferase 1 [Nitrospirota bacterium]
MARDGSQQNDRNLKGKTATSRLSGTLYIVGTPIGHPDDITLRALAILRSVSIIASEDPRETQRLLTHHGITATVTSYGPLNRQEKVPLLLHRLAQGQDVALVSDNGNPVIYDPGSQLVAAAHHAGIPVKIIPGPSAMTAATAISGFSGDAIIFEGKLPSTSDRLSKHLSQFRTERRTLAFYVDPGALTRLIKTLAQILPTRQVAIAINLTTNQEALFRGTPTGLLQEIGRVPRDSAVTVVIEGDGAGNQIKQKKGKQPRATPLHGGE